MRTRASWGNGPQLLHVKLPGVASGIGRNVIKLLMMIFSLFFLYRESDTLTGQVARVVDHFFATRLDRYMDAAGLMLKAAILGFLVTAIVQGAISGLGFAVFGVEAPVLLGVLTSVASLIPVLGTFLVWGTASAWLASRRTRLGGPEALRMGCGSRSPGRQYSASAVDQYVDASALFAGHVRRCRRAGSFRAGWACHWPAVAGCRRGGLA